MSIGTPPRTTGGRIHDVARRAGVSVGTVSNFFNHPERVSPAAMERVDAAIRELGYVRNDAARQLRLGASTSVGLIMLDVGNPFFTDMARAAEDAAAAHGLTVILGNSDQTESREASYLDVFEKQRVRGVLVSPIGDVTARLVELRRHGIESVLVDRASDIVDSVSVDDIAGGYLAVKHLLDSGRRRVMYVTGAVPVQQSVDRLEGARRAAAEVRGSSIEVVELPVASVIAGRELGRAIQERPHDSRPDAVFAVNDLLAMGVLQAFLGAGGGGLTVPRHIAIVGYDDIDFAASAVVPLTSVRQPSRMLGERAVELLVERLENPDLPVRTVVFQPELIVRDSSRS